jgi:hypothetical protein
MKASASGRASRSLRSLNQRSEWLRWPSGSTARKRLYGIGTEAGNPAMRPARYCQASALSRGGEVRSTATWSIAASTASGPPISSSACTIVTASGSPFRSIATKGCTAGAWCRRPMKPTILRRSSPCGASAAVSHASSGTSTPGTVVCNAESYIG